MEWLTREHVEHGRNEKSGKNQVAELELLERGSEITCAQLAPWCAVDYSANLMAWSSFQISSVEIRGFDMVCKDVSEYMCRSLPHMIFQQ